MIFSKSSKIKRGFASVDLKPSLMAMMENSELIITTNGNGKQCAWVISSVGPVTAGGNQIEFTMKKPYFNYEEAKKINRTNHMRYNSSTHKIGF